MTHVNVDTRLLQFEVKARATSWWQTKFCFYLNESELTNLKLWLQGWNKKHLIESTFEKQVKAKISLPENGEALRRIMNGFKTKHSLTLDQTGARDFVEPPNDQCPSTFSWKLIDIPPGVMQTIDVIGLPLTHFGTPAVELICNGMIQIPDYQNYIKDTKIEREMEDYDLCSIMVSALAEIYDPQI